MIGVQVQGRRDVVAVPASAGAADNEETGRA
jgi:hypothetical protein